MNIDIVQWCVNISKRFPVIGFVVWMFSYSVIAFLMILVPGYTIFRNGFFVFVLFIFWILILLSVWGTGVLLKSIIKRPRPYETGLFTPLFRSGGSSFPSLHSAFVGAISSGAYILHVPYWQGIVLLSLCVACSRVFGGVHYVTDIIAGFIIGGSIAFLINMSIFPVLSLITI